MNIMLKIDDEVITPPLNGAILAGITRDSTLTLLRDWGLRVSERPVSIDEVTAAAQQLHDNAADVGGNNLPLGGGTYNPDALTVADALSTATNPPAAPALAPHDTVAAFDPHADLAHQLHAIHHLA